MTTLTLRDVEIHVQTEPDSLELVPQWFDDKKVARMVIKRLKAGDAWAWSSVTIRVSYQGLESKPQTTPGCSYENEKEFRKSEFFAQMTDECLKDLNAKFQKPSPVTPWLPPQPIVPISLMKRR
jgi:hypothetical protein